MHTDRNGTTGSYMLYPIFKMSTRAATDSPTVRNQCEKNSSDIERTVIVRTYGQCDATDPHKWPSGELLENLCRTLTEREVSSTISADHNQSNPADLDNVQEWWQVSARRAMLEKFGYFERYSNDEKKLCERTYYLDKVDGVQGLWGKVVNEIMDQYISRSVNEDRLNESVDGKALSSDISLHHQDFIDFVGSQCSSSNNRQLQWSLMSCPRGVQFPLHAHPNLELIYCIRGELFEIRMQGEPITRIFGKSKSSDDSETSTNVIGPNLTDTKRHWSFGTLKSGQWLVNEVGSVHKSFTSARSDGGCDLLVLWGGSHANIVKPPSSPNIQEVVDAMADTLLIDESCCTNSKNHIVQETFLPDSER